MKGLSVVLILLMLVAGIAVRGSLAQPLTQETSNAYKHCVGWRSEVILESPNRCRPVGRVVVAQTEFEADNRVAVAEAAENQVGGINAADAAAGEGWIDTARAVLQVLLNLLNIVNQLRIVGGGLPQGTELASLDTLFDPVR